MRSGPDSPSSWLVAAACCVINTLLYGMARLSGVLFVASMPRFGVGREQAAFPFTFANFIRNLSGPLVGYLGHKLGVRPVATFGCLLAAVGVGTCFFAESINTVTVLWGTMFGLGFGLGNILLPVVINQYFDKHRATASGISFSGASLGSFVLPPLVEVLLATYGLSGTFLVLSGSILVCVPAALLLRKPDFEINSSKHPFREDRSSERQRITFGKKVKLYTVEDTSQPLSGQHSKTPKDSSNISKEARVMEISGVGPVLTYEERIKRLSTQTLLSTYSIRMSTPDALDYEQILENSKGRRQVDQGALNSEINSVNSNASDQDSVFAKYNPASSNHDKTVTSYNSHPPFPTRRSASVSVVPLTKRDTNHPFSKSNSDLYLNQRYYDEDFRRHMSEGEAERVSVSSTRTVDEKPSLGVFSVILDPVFVLVALTNALYCFTFVTVITVIVDFARDVGIGMTNEKYILMSLSIGDLIGRMGLGWVIDRGHLSKRRFAALFFLCQGITTTGIAWSTDFPMLVSLVALYGLAESGLIVIYPLIVADFIEEGKQTVAISCSNFLVGPLCLTVAPLIGFFRDEVGSYDNIFYGLSIMSALCCFAFILTPCIVKCRRTSGKD